MPSAEPPGMLKRGAASGVDAIMSDDFNVNEYWLKRGREGAIEEPRYAEYHRLQEHFLFDILRKGQISLRNIIELGCGSGRLTKPLAEHYPIARILALDLSPDQLEKARCYCAGSGNILFERYDFYSGAPLPGSGYDAAVAVEVFLHHPRTLVRSLIEKVSAISLYLVNIDWSETWPWKTPDHVWVHDYQAVYAEAGLRSAAFVLPQKIEGMQQKLFIASKKMTHEMVHLLELAEQAASVQDAAQNATAVSGAARWSEQLQRATAEILELVPAGDAFILKGENIRTCPQAIGWAPTSPSRRGPSQSRPPFFHTYTYATNTRATNTTISTRPNSPRRRNETAHGNRKMVSMSNTMNSIATR